jgi:hypothetical protein
VVVKALLYKVVELSNVDEHALERTVNDWVPQGWTFDGVQFAMRESSKRPSMAFVFFTREGDAAQEARGRSEELAQARLRTLAEEAPGGVAASAPTAYERLMELAEGGDDE